MEMKKTKKNTKNTKGENYGVDRVVGSDRSSNNAIN